MRYFEDEISGIDGSTATFVGYCLDNSSEIDPNRKRPSVLVIPGGGYEMTSDREAEPIEWLRTERVRHALKVGPQGVSDKERMELLSDPVALARLHALVWNEGHEGWLNAWRESVAADPHAPLLPLQPAA